MSWRQRVCAEALTWEGTKYVAKARVKGVGVDCGGLLYECYNPHFGPFKAFPDDYAPDWAMHEKNELYLDFIMPISVEKSTPLPGDFSLFHIGQNYAHAAILLPNGKYIHAWGRNRAGLVTQTAIRVMQHMGKGHPIRHFEPVKHG